MKHLSKILLYARPDFVDLNLLDHAVEMAMKDQAEIKVLHVISGYPKDIKEWWNVRNPKNLQDQIVNEGEDFLAGIVDRLKERGIKRVTTGLQWGRDFLEITHEVIANGHDLVLIGAKGQDGRMAFASTIRDLLSYCPCPLWVSKEKMTKRFKRIVAALGGKGDQVEWRDLNVKILHNAAAAAQSNKSELHIVHALTLYGGKGLKSGNLRSDLVQHLDDLRDEIQDKCTVLLSDYAVSLPREQIHLLMGAPELVISEFANDKGADLIVMGAMARANVPGMFARHTAEKILQQASADVLAVKPDGFVSPVE